MQSILMAISDLLASIFFGQIKVNKFKGDEIVVPDGYRPLYFNCWLCEGHTEFACKITIKDKTFIIDCSRCGVENAVTLK